MKNPRLTDREDAVYALRRQGTAFHDIGEQLQISKQRAYQIYDAAVSKMRRRHAPHRCLICDEMHTPAAGEPLPEDL